MYLGVQITQARKNKCADGELLQMAIQHIRPKNIQRCKRVDWRGNWHSTMQVELHPPTDRELDFWFVGFR
jgi:hypothetical protein